MEVTTPRDLEECLTGIWWLSGYAGAMEEDTGAEKRWKVFFGPDALPESLHDCAVRCAAMDKAVTARVETQASADWSSQWKTFFTPFEISPEWVITTEGIPHQPRPGQRPIVIIAGMAFGTGQHPSTQLIARAIARDVRTRRWDRALDVGTGTGILGLVALFAGVGHVDGVDADEGALLCAKENCIKNNILDRFSLTNTLSDAAAPYPLIVANILLDPLVQMAPVLTSLLAKDGDIYLSGILLEQEASLRTAYEVPGLRHIRTVTQGEWAMVQMRKL